MGPVKTVWNSRHSWHFVLQWGASIYIFSDLEVDCKNLLPTWTQFHMFCWSIWFRCDSATRQFSQLIQARSTIYLQVSEMGRCSLRPQQHWRHQNTLWGRTGSLEGACIPTTFVVEVLRPLCWRQRTSNVSSACYGGCENTSLIYVNPCDYNVPTTRLNRINSIVTVCEACDTGFILTFEWQGRCKLQYSGYCRAVGRLL